MNAENLDQENRIALQVVQAMLGLIDEEMMAVAFSLSECRIELNFLVSRAFDGIEDIQDIEFELDALTDGRYRIGHSIAFADEEPEWPNIGCRLLFKRKPLREE